MKKRPFRVGIISNDWHLPYPDKAAWNLFVAAAYLIKPDFFIVAGDGVEFQGVTRHKAPMKARVGFKDEIMESRKYIRQIESALPKKCDRVWLEGNHEEWMRLYLRENAEALSDFDEFHWPSLLRLKEWDVREVDDREYPICDVGKLRVTHGSRARKYSGQTAKLEVHERWESVMVGHTHRMGAYYFTPEGDRTMYAGYENGCLLDFGVAKKYKKYKPNWQHGFSVVVHDHKTGWFDVTQKKIIRVPGTADKKRLMLHEGLLEERG